MASINGAALGPSLPPPRVEVRGESRERRPQGKVEEWIQDEELVADQVSLFVSDEHVVKTFRGYP